VDADPTAQAIAWLAAKHEELLEPCPDTVQWDSEDRRHGVCTNGRLRWNDAVCPTCHGLGYVPKTGPALLAGLLDVAVDLGYVSFNKDQDDYGHLTGLVWARIQIMDYDFHEKAADKITALALALARAEGLDK
jgi:hypothetical protein